MSHTWGDRSQGEQILVNGKVITVSNNLAEGLLALSQHPGVVDGTLKIWNDVLCLDQQNKTEVQRELKRMSTIFSNAYAVMAWVGPATEGSEHVMDMLVGLNGFGDDDSTISHEILDSIPGPVWRALSYFLQRPYWRRMWIVQEITLAGKRTELVCGSHRTQLHSLLAFATLIIRNSSRCHRLIEVALGSNNVYFNKIRHDVFSVCARLYYLYEIDEMIPENTGYDMLGILDVCRDSLQQDARDKVYGILGLLPPRVSSLIEPDLNKLAHDVYADLVRATIKGTKRLDLLQNCKIHREQPKYPTWTPDLQIKSMSHTLGTRATMDAGSTLDIEPRLSPDGLLLTCRGFLIDVIEHLTPPQWPLVPVSPEEATASMSMISAPAQTKAMVRESLWRTIVGATTIGSPETPAPADYAQVLDIPWLDSSDVYQNDIYALAQSLVDQKWCGIDGQQDLITFLLFRQRARSQFNVCGYPLRSFFPSSDHLRSAPPQSLKTTGRQQQTMEKALRRASHTLKRRRLIVTANGRLGAAVREAKKGDYIAVIRGCSAPIVLRPATTSRSPSSQPPPDGTFMVVGACYVHGLMSGEVFKDQEEGDIVLC